LLTGLEKASKVPKHAPAAHPTVPPSIAPVSTRFKHRFSVSAMFYRVGTKQIQTG
jgi:hypothetical protein